MVQLIIVQKSICLFRFLFFLEQIASAWRYFFFIWCNIQLQDEAALTLQCMEKCRDGGFEEMFLTKIDYPTKYDYCVRYFDLICCLM